MEFSADSNCSQLNFNTSCFEFSESGFKVIAGFRTGLSALAAVMSLVAIVCCYLLKTYTKFVNRLIIYLCVAAFFNGIVTAIQLAPVKLVCGFAVAKDEFCRAYAGLIQYSVWTILVLISWIGVHIFLVIVFNKNFAKDKLSPNKKNWKHILYETSIVVSTLLIPIAFCTIPIHNYGLAGAWCWIRTTDEECHEIKSGVAEQFVLWYAPIMVFALVFIIVMIIMLIHVCLKQKTALGKLLEMRPLFIYPIIFIIVYSLGFANRVYYAATKNNIIGLWILHGIADTLLALIIPFAFFLHQRKNIRSCNRQVQAAAAGAVHYEPQENAPLISGPRSATFDRTTSVNVNNADLMKPE